MSRNKFFIELSKYIPKEDREDIFDDFNEHINLAMNQGKSEEGAVKSLGSPREIACEFGYNVENVQKNVSTIKKIGFIIIEFFVVIGLIILFAIWLSIWAIAFSIPVVGIVSEILVIVPLPFIPMFIPNWQVLLTGGISLIALGVFLIMLLISISKKLFRLVKHLAKKHCMVFSKGDSHEI